jgi:hypothetical protein
LAFTPGSILARDKLNIEKLRTNHPSKKPFGLSRGEPQGILRNPFRIH